MKLSDIKPFVRYSRHEKEISAYRYFRYPLCPRDCRLLYCYEGVGHICIGEKEYDVCRGTLLLWRAGVSYTYLPDLKDPMHLLGINFDYTFERADLTVPLPPRQHLDETDFPTVEAPIFEDAERLNDTLVIPRAGEHFYKRLLDIDREFQRKKAHFALKCSGILSELLADIAFLSENSTAASAPLPESIISYLNAHCGEPITLKTLGEQFGYHPNHLNHLFLKYTGRSLYAYLQDIRILRAISLLETTQMTVSEIASLCGFPDRAHFSRYFKQKTGRTAGDFRP